MKKTYSPRTKLIELRQKKGLTQEQMGKLLGITRSTYSNYEYGYREPSLQQIIKMKKIFKVSEDKFFLSDNDTISI